jgi:signal transduction histidine kinase
VSATPVPSRRFEREVRNVLVGGLVFALFLAGASLVVMKNTARWAEHESSGRARAAVAALEERIGRGPDAGGALAGDARAAEILRGAGALAAAVYDASGDRVATAAFLPEPSLAPARLDAADRPRGAVIERDLSGSAPASLRIAEPLASGSGTLLVVLDASALAAARRNAAALLTVVPFSAVALTLLVVVFLRRLVRPMEALAETARDAGAVVPAPVPGGVDGPEEAIATFARTIDELKKRTAELDALRRREQERADALEVTAETLVRSHPGGLVVVDAAGRLSQANAPAVEALGLRGFSAGTSARETLAGYPPLVRAIESAAAGEPTLGLELAIGEGTLARELALTAVPVADATGARLGTLLFLEDRTTTNRLQRELSARRELAALGEMSAGIAHEFRNATATILGWARLAAAEREEDARQRHLAAIRAEAQHVARVTGDFLFFARPETLAPERTDLAAVVADVLEEERLASTSTSLSSCGSFGEAEVDAALLRRALLNLVRNACEAAGAGTRAGRVLVRGEHGPDGGPRIAVEDDGPGVPAAEIPKLFVPFYSTKESGTGIGLALVARIAALHGGSVSVERSDELGGARFVLALPASARQPLPTPT